MKYESFPVKVQLFSISCKVLLRYQASPNATNNTGSSPLHLAAEHNCPQAARVLIAADADVNLQNKLGNTPMHRAASAGHFDFVWLLAGAVCCLAVSLAVFVASLSDLVVAANFADVHLANNSGRTVLEMAQRSGHQGIMELVRHPTVASEQA